MVYCAADSGLTQYTKSDITFPHQVELKANLDDVKANLRGLKNRPGSTRPADITNFIRKKAGYVNQVAMTYALTQKVGHNLFTISVYPSIHELLCSNIICIEIFHGYKPRSKTHSGGIGKSITSSQNIIC